MIWHIVDPRRNGRTAIRDGQPAEVVSTRNACPRVNVPKHMHVCIHTHTHTQLYARTCARVCAWDACVLGRLEARVRWRFSHLLAKWPVLPSAGFCSYTNLNYVERARGAGEREACVEHEEEARQKEKKWKKTEAARLLFFCPAPSPLLHARRSQGCARSEAVREGARRAGSESGLRSVRGWWPGASSGADHDYA